MNFFSFCIQEKEKNCKREKRKSKKGNRLKIWKSEYTEVDQDKMMEVK